MTTTRRQKPASYHRMFYSRASFFLISATLSGLWTLHRLHRLAIFTVAYAASAHSCRLWLPALLLLAVLTALVVRACGAPAQRSLSRTCNTHPFLIHSGCFRLSRLTRPRSFLLAGAGFTASTPGRRQDCFRWLTGRGHSPCLLLLASSAVRRPLVLGGRLFLQFAGVLRCRLGCEESFER